MNNFRELKVWQRSMDFAADLYKELEMMPASEKYNLTSQMQRAGVSIPSNLAEGCGRHSDPAFRNFCSISLGSSYELETQLILAQRLDFLTRESYDLLQPRLTEIQKMTFGLMTFLKA